MPNFQYTPEQAAHALSYDRMGGACYVNVCGDGETTLPKEIPSYVREMLKQGHYVDLITNCVIEKRIDELLGFNGELLSRLMLKCSFHWLEMKRTNTLDAYVRNINKLKAKGVAYTIEITPYDALIPHINEIIAFCGKNCGSLPQITMAWNDADNTTLLSKLSKEEFRRVWSVFDSPMTDFKLSTMDVKRKEFCYAGDWSIYVNLATGWAVQCYCSNVTLGNIFENPDASIPFTAVGNNCRTPHCRNSHMLLTLGTIPRLNDVCYEVIRNRQCVDGSEWLSTKVKYFLSSKLEESNEEYSAAKKFAVNLKNRVSPYGIARVAASITPKPIKDMIKKIMNRTEQVIPLCVLHDTRRAA
jgi:hypothetical protein